MNTQKAVTQNTEVNPFLSRFKTRIALSLGVLLVAAFCLATFRAQASTWFGGGSANRL